MRIRKLDHSVVTGTRGLPELRTTEQTMHSNDGGTFTRCADCGRIIIYGQTCTCGGKGR